MAESTTPRLIEVRINPKLHPGQTPEDELQRLVWEALDTAWGLLSEYATRMAIVHIREGLKEQGIGFLTDEELFAGAAESDNPDVPKSYADMIIGDPLAGEALEAAFERMQDVALTSAAGAFGIQLVHDEEG